MTNLPAVPEPAALPISQQAYDSLLDNCQRITDAARDSLIEHYWHLGRHISDALPAEREESYGKAIILALERDLAIDRVTLWRCIKLYQTYKLGEILAARQVSWSKAKMLLPLDPDHRRQIEERLAAGELRTDDDVRHAIYQLKLELGLISEPDRPAYRHPTYLGIKGLGPRKLHEILCRVQPMHQAFIFGEWLSVLDLTAADRPQALSALDRIQAELDRAREKIDEPASASAEATADEPA